MSAAGLVPVMGLALEAGLGDLADNWLSVPTDKGATAGPKVASLVAGMVAGADSIDDMALLRHGGMGRLFKACYAPSTRGSFLRSFTFGHVRPLDAVASRFLGSLAAQTPLIGSSTEEYTLVDVDDTIIEVHGYKKQGSGYGYSGVRGLNALLATARTKDTAPVILAQRLRKGQAGSPRGAARLVADALVVLKRIRAGAAGKVLLRADSAFYGYATVNAATKAGAAVSVTVRMDPAIRKAIAAIGEAAWTPIQYTDAVFDESADRWISAAEVAETPFTAFSSRKQGERVTGRLVVRRIPDLNPHASAILGRPVTDPAPNAESFRSSSRARSEGKHRTKGPRLVGWSRTTGPNKHWQPARPPRSANSLAPHDTFRSTGPFRTLLCLGVKP